MPKEEFATWQGHDKLRSYALTDDLVVPRPRPRETEPRPRRINPTRSTAKAIDFSHRGSLAAGGTRVIL